MSTTRKLTVLIASAMLILSAQAFSQEPTRITFLHTEESSWGNTRETEGYITKWNITTLTTVFLPVDVEAYNNGTIDIEGEDEVCFLLQTPENQGLVNITVSGYLNVTAKGVIPLSGYTDFHNTTSWPVTTPLGEWNISYPIPVPVPIGAFVIVVTVKPTLFMNASVTANTSVEGPATISPAKLSWKTDGAVENVSVQCSAQAGDDITVVAKDFTYDWNASVTVDLSLEGIHLITSPPYWFETPSLQADGEAAVSFNITVIPEFPRLVLIGVLCLAEAALLLYFKKKVLAQPA
jgi:hypothetical protein